MKISSPTSLPDFQRVFPDEAACYTYLYDARFPNGFICPYCGWEENAYRFRNRPDMLRCKRCKRDTRLKAGTIMQKSQIPLHTWFWGTFLITSLTPGMSALQFQKMLGIKRYETAFNMLHKLRTAMVQPERDAIGGEWSVEVDETYVGGATQGEGRGRNIIAGRLRLQVLPNRKREKIEPFVLENVKSGTEIRTDGWTGYDNFGRIIQNLKRMPIL